MCDIYPLYCQNLFINVRERNRTSTHNQHNPYGKILNVMKKYTISCVDPRGTLLHQAVQNFPASSSVGLK